MNEIVRDNLNVEVNDTVELFPEDIPLGIVFMLHHVDHQTWLIITLRHT